jgi:hypothetical protein
MIYPVTMYECKCDVCGKNWNDDAVVILTYPDTHCLQHCIEESGDWLTKDDKHYCPDCHSFDDEDSLIIAPRPYQPLIQSK